VHIAYYDLSNQDLKYATNAYGSWEAYTLDSTGNVGRGPALLVGANKWVYISYVDVTNNNLKLVTIIPNH
jgi:hypothetical protein